jgi:hypothetical protein
MQGPVTESPSMAIDVVGMTDIDLGAEAVKWKTDSFTGGSVIVMIGILGELLMREQFVIR